MRSVKITVITTTINVPVALESYVNNFQAYGHENVDFVVIGDLKTPQEIEPYLNDISLKGYEADYWGVKRQKAWLQQFSDLDELLPYNSIQRRNLGYLIAYQSGADIIISIDDDNYAVPEYDFIGEHSLIGCSESLHVVRSSTSWFNVCDLLETTPPRRIYHRGFPHSKRWQDEKIFYSYSKGHVVVNEGLWLGVPDVDAVTHLEEPLKVTGFKSNLDKQSIALALGTWSPFNTQNTAFHKDLLPCMYLPIMGNEVAGIQIGRYDDIWMSYFAKKIIDHLGDYVAFGKPLVRQQRNPHDYLHDLKLELYGMILTEKLINSLNRLELSGTSYFTCYLELIKKLRANISESQSYSYEEKAYLLYIIYGMSVWSDVVKKIIKEVV